jgi:hypothetical protein
MKKMMYLLLIACCLVSVLNGCNKKTEAEFYEVELQNVPNTVQDFMDRNSKKNGVYLYSKINLDSYLFLNAFNVIQGEKAAYFKDIKYNINENTLNIYFNEELTDDYTMKLDNRLIYKIKSSMEFDTIKVFRNDREIPIDVVGT